MGYYGPEVQGPRREEHRRSHGRENMRLTMSQYFNAWESTVPTRLACGLDLGPSSPVVSTSHTLNYLGTSVSTKGTDFKLMCQLRIDGAVKTSSYLEVWAAAGVVPSHHNGRDTYSFVRLLMECGLGLQFFLKERTAERQSMISHIVTEPIPLHHVELSCSRNTRSPATSCRNAKPNAAYFARHKTTVLDSLAKK